ncbi:MAG: ferritin [Finegoldia sp.]|nr:ferritin [Finegoldia sp.]
MSNKEFLDHVQDQLTFELQSAYIYKGMASYFADEDWEGFERFMEIQAIEEMSHAEDFKRFLQRVGYKVEYKALDEVTSDYSSILDVLEKALEHEKKVTARIEKLYKEANEIGYSKAYSFLLTYLDEQAEEEENFDNLINKVKKAGDNISAQTMIDKAVGGRPFPSQSPMGRPLGK